jgi:hypothetical protein
VVRRGEILAVTMKRRLALCLVASVVAASANAATITWEYAGVVRDVRGDTAFVTGASSLGIAAGTPVTGQVSYEYPTLDLNPNPGKGLYTALGSTYSFHAGAYSASQVNGSTLSISLDVLSPPDFLSIEAFLGSDIAADALFPTGSFWNLDLLAEQPSIFPNDSQPTQPPALGDLRPFSLGDISGPMALGVTTGLQLTSFTGGSNIYIELTQLVPEPWRLTEVALLLLVAARLRWARAA